jgi:hypothetical protein
MAYYYVRSKDVRLWNDDARSENRRRRGREQPGRVGNVSFRIEINTYRIDPSRIFVKTAILYNVVHCFGLILTYTLFWDQYINYCMFRERRAQ